MPTPIEATIRWPLNPNEPNTHAMIAIAITMTRAVSVTPCLTAPASSCFGICAGTTPRPPSWS